MSQDFGNAHGSLLSYIFGFSLSIIFTIIPFALVYYHWIDNKSIALGVIMLFALGQLLIQLIFFLHFNTESKPRWNLMAFLFTLFVVIIVIGGSLWIMDNLNTNMM